MRRTLAHELPVLEELVRGVRGADVIEAMALVVAAYVRLGVKLPRDNAWRYGKLADGARGAQQIDALRGVLPISDALVDLLAFCAFSADIGRLVIVDEHAQGNKGRTQTAHGNASVEVMRNIGALAHLPSWVNEMVCSAIAAHSAIKTRTRDMFDDLASYVLVCLLRDLDKMLIIAEKSYPYCWDEAERQRQLVSNRLVDSTEITPEVLEKFESGALIDRLQCVTFVDWLLQFLAWPLDFNYEETWRIANKNGGYKPVFDWLRQHIEETLFQRILVAARRIGHNV